MNESISTALIRPIRASCEPIWVSIINQATTRAILFPSVYTNPLFPASLCYAGIFHTRPSPTEHAFSSKPFNNSAFPSNVSNALKIQPAFFALKPNVYMYSVRRAA